MIDQLVIVVDGYSTGRVLVSTLVQRQVRVLHIQSTQMTFPSLGMPNTEGCFEKLVYSGSLAELVARIKGIVGQQKIACIIPGSEPGVELADQLNVEFSMPNQNDIKFSSARRNKFLMRQALSEQKIQMPKFINASDFQTIISWLQAGVAYPVVLKPLSSAGSDGVRICYNEDDLLSAFNAAMTSKDIFMNDNASVVVEEFLRGPEYIVNTVSHQGRHKVVDIWGYRKQKGPNGSWIYDREQTIDFETEEARVLSEYAVKIVGALGVCFGPSHLEIIITDAGPRLVEIGARLSGALDMELSHECFGYDAVNLTVDTYLYPEQFLRRLEQPNKLIKHGMVVDLATQQSGIVKSERFSRELSTLPSMVSMKIKLRPGDQVKPTQDLLSSPFACHLAHKDIDQLELDYNQVQKVGAQGFELLPQASLLAQFRLGGEKKEEKVSEDNNAMSLRN